MLTIVCKTALMLNMKLTPLQKLRSYSRNKKPQSLVAFRVTKEELKIIKNKSKKLTAGNVSDFVRHAVLSWNPEESSLNS
jgi:hypothetical protein